MKKRVELDVDFIGGGPMPTKEEFAAISEYIKASKAKRKLRTQRKATRTKPNTKQPA
ncbi:MAG: hypothetical protein IT249_02465 [Chitinophagaceae bacterium]|nr:hypothetical protein [Chitinophagaceae bacterium]